MRTDPRLDIGARRRAHHHAPRHRRRCALPVLARLLASLALLSLAGCAAETERVSRRDCEALRTHVVDLRMASVTADQAGHRSAIEDALGERFVTSCVERTTETQLRCALQAQDSQALAACHRP